MAEQPFQIVVMDLSGKKYVIQDLRKSMKISEVIERICKKASNLSNESVILIFRGKVINQEATDTTKTLESLEVEDGSTLMLIHRLNG